MDGFARANKKIENEKNQYRYFKYCKCFGFGTNQTQCALYHDRPTVVQYDELHGK